jgi:hypothetical protein
MQGLDSLIAGKVLRSMNSSLSKNEIIANLGLLSDWLQAKHPTERFELLLVGGAALSPMGNKDQTNDIDILKPHPLPETLRQGIRAVAKARRLAADWLNDRAAEVFSTGPYPEINRFPQYFREIARTFSIGNNLKLHIIGRQALISLKLYACNPSIRKHIDDLKTLQPNKEEVKIAARFCLANDSHITSRKDLAAVIRELEFDPDEVL